MPEPVEPFALRPVTEAGKRLVSGVRTPREGFAERAGEADRKPACSAN